ncbi:TonB-dependent receptor (plasmid) [Azospirillum argentinense]|uniref:TonB-dependent receptor n=1 Tax=Azospirillum brasilense TaxID=192 RepID=A0A4D8QB02_AZOBR|nr:TonB-dependent receptor [Azospirillum argentinense]
MNSLVVDIFNPTYPGTEFIYADPWVNGKSKLSQIGAYLQDQLRYDNWILTLSGRQDWWSARRSTTSPTASRPRATTTSPGAPASATSSTTASRPTPATRPRSSRAPARWRRNAAAAPSSRPPARSTRSA